MAPSPASINVLFLIDSLQVDYYIDSSAKFENFKFQIISTTL